MTRLSAIVAATRLFHGASSVRKGLALCINTIAFDGDTAGFLQATPPELVVVDA